MRTKTSVIDQNRETARHHNVTDMHIEPQTESKPTAPDTIAIEDRTHEAINNFAGNIQNKTTKIPETRPCKRVHSAPNEIN